MAARSLALALLLGLAPAAAHACGPVLVSGFDDVVRQAENTGVLRAARRLMAPDAGYAGMPELYRILACPGAQPPMYVVSAMTSAFTSRARRFLADAGFPAAELQFRRWLLHWSPGRFRLARIEGLLALHPGRKFVFVFDNSPTSLGLAHKLLHAHPARVSAIYVRETVRQEPIAGVVPFITAFDVAANEFAAGRITESEAAGVAAAILDEPDANRIVPTYSYCPRPPPRCAVGHPDLAHQCERVRDRLQSICASRGE